MASVGEKADYVRAKIAEGRSGNHHCHWPGCDKKVPPAQWGCRQHWYKLPQALRNKIWRAYRPGQEITKTPSPEYLAWCAEVDARKALPPLKLEVVGLGEPLSELKRTGTGGWL